ncbi:MAG: alcohol dehydrogenase catalytic domain-containing protein [Pirellulales bacterium]
MATMRIVQVSRPKGPFEIVERPILEPGAGSVRVKVEACGICHSDDSGLPSSAASPTEFTLGHNAAAPVTRPTDTRVPAGPSLRSFENTAGFVIDYPDFWQIERAGRD